MIFGSFEVTAKHLCGSHYSMGFGIVFVEFDCLLKVFHVLVDIKTGQPASGANPPRISKAIVGVRGNGTIEPLYGLSWIVEDHASQFMVLDTPKQVIVGRHVFRPFPASFHHIRGFHSTDMRLKDAAVSAELMQFMGYEKLDHADNVTRFIVPGGNEANIIDIEELPTATRSAQGAGSVHHIAFAVENRARQLEVREALLDTGYQVTPVIDRDYFYAIYFRTPGGVLFEVATNEPGFDRDEDTAHLGEALKLPSQHEHLRARLERLLQPLDD